MYLIVYLYWVYLLGLQENSNSFNHLNRINEIRKEWNPIFYCDMNSAHGLHGCYANEVYHKIFCCKILQWIYTWKSKIYFDNIK